MLIAKYLHYPFICIYCFTNKQFIMWVKLVIDISEQTNLFRCFDFSLRFERVAETPAVTTRVQLLFGG